MIKNKSLFNSVMLSSSLMLGACASVPGQYASQQQGNDQSEADSCTSIAVQSENYRDVFGKCTDAKQITQLFETAVKTEDAFLLRTLLDYMGKKDQDLQEEVNQMAAAELAVDGYPLNERGVQALGDYLHSAYACTMQQAPKQQAQNTTSYDAVDVCIEYPVWHKQNHKNPPALGGS